MPAPIAAPFCKAATTQTKLSRGLSRPTGTVAERSIHFPVTARRAYPIRAVVTAGGSGSGKKAIAFLSRSTVKSFISFRKFHRRIISGLSPALLYSYLQEYFRQRPPGKGFATSQTDKIIAADNIRSTAAPLSIRVAFDRQSLPLWFIAAQNENRLLRSYSGISVPYYSSPDGRKRRHNGIF